MSPFERATAPVLAADAGLAAAGLHRPVLAAAAVLLGRTPRRALVLCAVAGLAAAWGSVRVAGLDRDTLPRGRLAAVVTVTGQPGSGHAPAAVGGTGQTVLLETRAPLEEGGAYRVRGTVGPIDPVVRGYYATQGIHAVLRAGGAHPAGRRGGAWGWVDAARRRILAALRAGPSAGRDRALVAGIAVGDLEGMPAADRADLRASGLYHVVAVSGQNVALLVLFTVVVLGAAGVVGVPARLVAVGVTGAYVLVAGSGPSIVRAGVAGILAAAAWIVSRPVDRLHLVACGAAVVLAVNPLELLDPGFQLSFAAVLAIHLVVPRMRAAVGEAAAVSIACTLATAPIAWWHFGRASPLAVPANLLALPAVAPVLWLAAAAAVVGQVSSAAAAPLLRAADLLAAYVLLVAHACG
jgi:competence protein ComEC